MKMDLMLIFDNWQLIIIGAVWMSIHAGLLILVAKLIKAPFFFLAVGSQANVGGAASAPIVASAFHPSLATVGVFTGCIWVCHRNYWRRGMYFFNATGGCRINPMAYIN